MTTISNISNLLAGENISSLVTIIVLVLTTIGGFVAWVLEHKKRKYDDYEAKLNIVEEMNQKHDEAMKEITELRLQVSDLTFELDRQKKNGELQDKKIKDLEGENKTLRENQKKLIAENKELRENQKKLVEENKELRERQELFVKENSVLKSELDSLKASRQGRKPAKKDKEASK